MHNQSKQKYLSLSWLLSSVHLLELENMASLVPGQSWDEHMLSTEAEAAPFLFVATDVEWVYSFSFGMASLLVSPLCLTFNNYL